MFNLRFRTLGYIIGFSAIFLILTSNLMINHQNFSTAYPIVNKVSFDELGKFAIMPMKDTPRDFGPSSITTNPNNEEWKNRLCENTNQAGINIGIPFMCDPSNNIGQNENTNQQNENTNQLGQDISDKVHEKIGNLKDKFDDSIFGNIESDNSQSNSVQSNSKNDNNNGKGNNKNGNDDGNNEQENSEQQLFDKQGGGKAKSELDDDMEGNSGNHHKTNNGNNDNNANNGNNQGNNGNNQGNNNDDGLGIAGLDLGLNIDKKLGKVDEKIDNLKNNLGPSKQENKDNQKNNNDQGENDDTLRITGLVPNIQNIQANLDKQIEKLKDKFENEKDNQRLIDQRNEFDDDEDDDNKDSDGGDDGNAKDYDGYGFKGDDDNGNGNKHENGEENFNFAAAGDFGCSTNTQNTIENMQSKDPEIVLTLGDHSYHSTADCWFDMMSPVKDKLMLTLGYHDVEDGQAKMNQYMNSFALEKPFYSYDYNKVHFLVMSAKS
ncbi:MAG TPA: hypothetical protein VD694_02880, partial [Nitrososphaeraceae archaeon]|nr:hypothetical protein [Nitrososphaeraceae archaeon]